MIKFRGLNGTLVLNDNSVLILREKGIDGTFHDIPKIEIPFSNITKIEVVQGGLTNGYICIADSECRVPSNVFKAMKNDNTVIFRVFKNALAERFAEELRHRI